MVLRYVILSVSTIEKDSFVNTHRIFIICCLIIFRNDIGTCRDLLNVFVKYSSKAQGLLDQCNIPHVLVLKLV